ncbi:MAG: GAF domain-containing protein, partial [Oscillospiraceae bacterium]|nr:GAF domain-containing protein [Oscillospiraceae bacterium]
MSIRVKIVSVITLISVVIVIFGIGTGMVFVQGNLEKSIENDMTAVADVSDKLITTAINLLKADASIVVQRLYEAPPEDCYRILRRETEAYNNFIAMTVFNRDGIAYSYGIQNTHGVSTAPEELVNNKYVQRAFDGETVISTTYVNASGRLVFYLCIPMGEQVLCATVPGTFFSDIITDFKIWETGNIFIVDAEGTILANIRKEWVTERYNFIEKAESDEQYSRIAATIKHMIAGETGQGRFAVGGVERMCIYKPITGSKVGWSLGVVAPIVESPLSNVRRGLVIVAAVCVVLSIAAAFFASVPILRPYKTISDLLASLEGQEKLLYTINDAAATLLRVEADSFEGDILTCMGAMAECAGVDRMRVWRNYSEDGRLYCTQMYEWSGDAESQVGKDITINISYDEHLPGWENTLSSGHTINGFVSNFSPEEQEQLRPQGILSMLVIPVIFHRRFWGFVGFDDCHTEREFTHDEENLLRS